MPLSAVRRWRVLEAGLWVLTVVAVRVAGGLALWVGVDSCCCGCASLWAVFELTVMSARGFVCVRVACVGSLHWHQQFAAVNHRLISFRWSQKAQK